MDSDDPSAADLSIAELSTAELSSAEPCSADSPLADPADGAGAVRGEAARTARRLELAQDRIAAARGPVGAGSGGSAGSDAAWGGFDDVDDNLRSLLAPAVDRISRLSSVAAAMADGTLSDESAAEAARVIAAAQPHRRPR